MSLKILSDREEAERRLAICAHCPHLKEHQRCGKCGCKMPIKVRLKVLHCPEGRW